MRLEIFTTICIALALIQWETALADQPRNKESCWVSPEYERHSPHTIAVMPMDNLSLEPEMESILLGEVYTQLSQKGYMKISMDTVTAAMERLGIEMAGQVSAFSSRKLARELKCDALLMGRIDQSAHINQGIFDAVVVSCTLWLKDLKSGSPLWQADQWRVAHRQWQLDPFNALINYVHHKTASRRERVRYLVHQMLATLPQGPVRQSKTSLLKQAVIIPTEELTDD